MRLHSRFKTSAPAHFLLFLLLGGIFAACAPNTPTTFPDLPSGTPALEDQATPVIETPTVLTTPTTSEEFAHTFGLTVVAKSLCSDGVTTTLVLETTINTRLWQLPGEHFFPQGKTYYETRIALFENGFPFGSTMSGFRDEPKYNPLNGMVSTTQIFEFPQPPQPGSVFTLTAEISLLELPQTYTPPPPIVQVAPSYIEIPMKYEVPVRMGPCP